MWLCTRLATYATYTPPWSQWALERDMRVLILVGRKELISQTITQVQRWLGTDVAVGKIKVSWRQILATLHEQPRHACQGPWGR